MSPLAHELEQAHSNFWNAVASLEMFVTAARGGITDTQATNEVLVAKFAAAARGELPEPPKEDEFAVELSAEQVEGVWPLLQAAGARAAGLPTVLNDLALIYLVALYEAFSSDVCLATLQANPRMLRSNKQLSYATISNSAARRSSSRCEVRIGRRLEVSTEYWEAARRLVLGVGSRLYEGLEQGFA